MKTIRKLRNFLLVTSLLGAVSPAYAVDYYFDLNGTADGYGTGTGAYSGTVWGTLSTPEGTATPALATSYPIGDGDNLYFGTGNSGFTGTVTGGRKFTGSGNLRIGSASGNILFSDTWELAGTSGNGIRSSSTATIEFNDVITGTAGSVNQTGSGTLILSNTANTFGGSATATDNVTTISGGGTIKVNKLANGGATSSLGDSSNAATRLVFNNGSLVHYGAAASSTDRNFTIKSNGGTISNDSVNSAHTLTWSGGATLDAAANRSLTLGGTNTGDNTFSGTLADNGAGKLSLTKSGAGKWIFDNAKTYTGTTTISNGTLALGALGSINNTSGVVLGGGTFDVSAKTSYDVANLSGNGSVLGTMNVTTSLKMGGDTNAATINFANLALTSGTTAVFDLTGGATAGDLGDISGRLALANATLDLVQLGVFMAGNKFTLFAYDGTLTGTFNGLANGATFNDAGGDWQINYLDTTAGLNGGTGIKYVTVTALAAIPEPRAALLGCLGVLFLLRRRR